MFFSCPLMYFGTRLNGLGLDTLWAQFKGMMLVWILVALLFKDETEEITVLVLNHSYQYNNVHGNLMSPNPNLIYITSQHLERNNAPTVYFKFMDVRD